MAKRLKQEDIIEDEVIEEEEEDMGPGYVEMIMYGLIEGTTAYYSDRCRGGLVNTINGVFRMVDHW